MKYEYFFKDVSSTFTSTEGIKIITSILPQVRVIEPSSEKSPLKSTYDLFNSLVRNNTKSEESDKEP